MAKSIKKEIEVKEVEVKPVSFTGSALSVICHSTNNQFRNFKILKLTIKDGIVTHMEESDPYASFETIAKAEVQLHRAILDLNDSWEDGKSIS